MHEALAGSMITILLSAGSNPSKLDHHGMTPYQLTNTKAGRNAYRYYRGDEPDKWDYEAAKIPAHGPIPIPNPNPNPNYEAAKIPEALTVEGEAEKKSRDKARSKVKEKERKKKKAAEKKAAEEVAKAKEVADEAKRMRSAGKATADSTSGPGGWTCAGCTFLNVPSRTVCLMCSNPRVPIPVATDGWWCNNCTFQNMPKTKECAMCFTKKPKANTLAASSITTPKPPAGPACDYCGKSLDGITPFSRLEFAYCSVPCVHCHRAELEKK